MYNFFDRIAIINQAIDDLSAVSSKICNVIFALEETGDGKLKAFALRLRKLCNGEPQIYDQVYRELFELRKRHTQGSSSLEPNADFTIGDVVTLKGGGPPLTVSSVNGLRVVCLFGDGEVVGSIDIPLACLRLFEKQSVA